MNALTSTTSDQGATQIVGIRFQRHDTVHLVTFVGPLLALDDVVLAEIDGQCRLATVCIPSNSILIAPSSTVQGTIIAAGLATPEVEHALEEINRATLDVVRALAGMPPSLSRASWSTDFARLTVSFVSELPANLDEIRERIAAAVRAQVVLISLP